LNSKGLSRKGLLRVLLLMAIIFSVCRPAARLGAQILQARDQYQIHVGDQLDVRFRLTPEYNQVATVQPDGRITLTIAGELKVATLTVGEVEAMIAKQSSSRLVNPDVAITLLTFQKPYFVVAGQVSKPGKYDMQEDTTAMQALLISGGVTESGKATQVLVYRKINGGGAQVKVLNLNKIMKTSDLERDYQLQSGDMLYVPFNTLTKVTQYMRIGNSLGLYLNPLQVVP